MNKIIYDDTVLVSNYIRWKCILVIRNGYNDNKHFWHARKYISCYKKRHIINICYHYIKERV